MQVIRHPSIWTALSLLVALQGLSGAARAELSRSAARCDKPGAVMVCGARCPANLTPKLSAFFVRYIRLPGQNRVARVRSSLAQRIADTCAAFQVTAAPTDQHATVVLPAASSPPLLASLPGSPRAP